MANIHRIGDLNNRPRQQQDNGDIMGGMFSGQIQTDAEFIRNCAKYKVPFFEIKAFKPARQQNYCDFITNTFCPVLKCCSFTTIICLIDIAIFIAEVSLGLNRAGDLLQVNANTLNTFKANYAISVYRGEVYRQFTAIAVHISFMHLFGNLITTLILVSRVQYTLGIIYTIIIYLFSGICGNIFSLAIQTNYSTISAGASTSLYGILGLLFGYVFINWNGLNFLGAKKCQLLCMLILLLFFTIVFTSTTSGVDYYGHLGGFLAGLWLAGLPPPIINQTREKIIRVTACIFFCTQILVCFIVFYLGKSDLKAASNSMP